MIDEDGFRANVCIVLVNGRGQVLWAKRRNQRGWQFPQGGMKAKETPEQAMYRELEEEVGLLPEHVEVLMSTRDWLHYRLPGSLVRLYDVPQCIGQKQIWFLLRMLASDDCINLERSAEPEFECWEWVDFWHPMSAVVWFKRGVYQQALEQFAVFFGLQPPRS